MPSPSSLHQLRRGFREVLVERVRPTIGLEPVGRRTPSPKIRPWTLPDRPGRRSVGPSYWLLCQPRSQPGNSTRPEVETPYRPTCLVCRDGPPRDGLAPL